MFSSLVHLKLNLNISSPYLIKFHDFEDNSQGVEASNERCNSGSTGHDFMDNFFALALFHPAFRLSSSVPEKSRF
jgi:hypothetical protein